MNKVVLAGGSGYLGILLANFYRSKAKEVVVLSRKTPTTDGNLRTVHWNGKDLDAWADELNEADLLVNLTGKNVNCRYTQKNKDEILNSRIDATEVLGKAIQHLKSPPKVWIQGASATIYRHAEDRYMDEQTGEIGSGFSVDVCKAWEEKFWEQKIPHTRKIVLRIGIVLGNSDGAFPRLLTLVRTGLGGKQGNGRQYMSWIHEMDVAEIIHWMYSNESLQGTYNCTSPGPLKNEEFMKTLRTVCGAPIGLPAPSWLLNIGALLIGTETELILKSRWVMPTKLTAAGYQFKFPDFRSAAEHIVRNATD